MRLFLIDFFFKNFKFFSKKSLLRFLSLRYSADFRRSRLVIPSSTAFVHTLDFQHPGFRPQQNTKSTANLLVGAFLVKRARHLQWLVFVGAFLVKSARHLQWLVFFVRLQSHSDWATFLTIETTSIRPSPVSGN